MPVPDQNVLAKFFPDTAVESVQRILEKNGILLVITRDRLSKLGDFKAGNARRPHRISVNGSLNKYACLLVFLHELAHLDIYKDYGRTVLPHGKEWKCNFGKLIRKCIAVGIFPEALTETLYTYSFNVKASGMADATLTKKLRIYDSVAMPDGWCHLDELPEKILFQTKNGRSFAKGDRLRTRYKCQCLHTKRQYLVHSLALVKKLED